MRWQVDCRVIAVTPAAVGMNVARIYRLRVVDSRPSTSSVSPFTLCLKPRRFCSRAARAMIRRQSIRSWALRATRSACRLRSRMPSWSSPNSRSVPRLSYGAPSVIWADGMLWFCGGSLIVPNASDRGTMDSRAYVDNEKWSILLKVGYTIIAQCML